MDILASPPFAALTTLLGRCGLPSDDIAPDQLADFFWRPDNGAARGAIGLQISGPEGLLRSLGVVPESRGQGLGTELVRTAERHARARGVRTLYLLTNDATAFFRRLGYEALARDQAPAAIRATAQFGSACCAGATLMRKSIAP